MLNIKIEDKDVRENKKKSFVFFALAIQRKPKRLSRTMTIM